MIFERGPRGFIKGTAQMIRFSIEEGSPMDRLLLSASVHISERMAILSRLRCLLAAFLAEVCMLGFFLGVIIYSAFVSLIILRVTLVTWLLTSACYACMSLS